MKLCCKNMLLGFVIVTIFLLVSCQIGSRTTTVPEYLEEVEIPSFLELYPVFHHEAEKWSADAQLDSIIINVLPGVDNGLYVSMIFRSSIHAYEILMIYYRADGCITTDIVDFQQPVFETRGVIELSEQILDSVDAWDIFLGYRKVLSYSVEAFECAKLALVPSKIEGQVAVWRLSVGGCDASEEHRFFEIDACTGERLE